MTIGPGQRRNPAHGTFDAIYNGSLAKPKGVALQRYDSLRHPPLTAQ